MARRGALGAKRVRLDPVHLPGRAPHLVPEVGMSDADAP
jgi:hypothetical protein